MQSFPVDIDRACVLINIGGHIVNSSITLSTTAVVEGFRCDASVLLVTGSSRQPSRFLFNTWNDQVRSRCKEKLNIYIFVLIKTYLFKVDCETNCPNLY